MRRDGICIHVGPANRARRETIITDRNTSSKSVWRAEIVLAPGVGLGTNAILKRTGKSKPWVWRWQGRYVDEGVDGLLCDTTRPPGKVAAVGCSEAQGAGQDGQRGAAGCDALERAVDSDGDGDQPHERSEHLGKAGLKPHLVRTTFTQETVEAATKSDAPSQTAWPSASSQTRRADGRG